MVAKSRIRGHEIYYDPKLEVWKYVEDDSLVNKVELNFNNEYSDELDKRCPRCKMINKFDAPDYCLGYLPGVSNACCGHGENEGYISFTNGITVRFKDLRIEGIEGLKP